MNVSKYLSPYKLNRAVLHGSGVPGTFDECSVDCPYVFHHQDSFYMMYVGFNGAGYQTALAKSGDLVNWDPLGLILEQGEGHGWDSRNAAGCWMLRENDLDGVPKLKKWQNKYWLAYHAYPEEGYEAGPGRIGLAWTEDESLLQWHRLPEPILNPEDGAEWERGGLYKECLVEHKGTFYLFYNAKNTTYNNPGDIPWKEQTGVATSTDLVHWIREASNPILRVSDEGGWDSQFASDPCVPRGDDGWVMYYFGYDDKHAQEGIALSSDLIHWEKHPEPILANGKEGEIDSIHAHKPSVIKHNGILYHFYCSCRPIGKGTSPKASESNSERYPWPRPSL